MTKAPRRRSREETTGRQLRRRRGSYLPGYEAEKAIEVQAKVGLFKRSKRQWAAALRLASSHSSHCPTLFLFANYS